MRFCRDRAEAQHRRAVHGGDGGGHAEREQHHQPAGARARGVLAGEKFRGGELGRVHGRRRWRTAGRRASQTRAYENARGVSPSAVTGGSDVSHHDEQSGCAESVSVKSIPSCEFFRPRVFLCFLSPVAPVLTTEAAPAPPTPAKVDYLNILPKALKPAIFVINNGVGTGTGFVGRLHGKIFLITNLHMIFSAKDIVATNQDGIKLELGDIYGALDHEQVT